VHQAGLPPQGLRPIVSQGFALRYSMIRSQLCYTRCLLGRREVAFPHQRWGGTKGAPECRGMVPSPSSCMTSDSTRRLSSTSLPKYGATQKPRTCGMLIICHGIVVNQR